ncbi:MAG TPA: iron-containing alcohol dehydrogenase [Candidatus Xenobia bacterium]
MNGVTPIRPTPALKAATPRQGDSGAPVDSVVLSGASSVTASRAGGFVPVEKDGWIQTQVPGIKLKVGPISSLTPELVLSHKTLPEIVAGQAGPDTLIVTDQFNYPALKDLGGACVKVHAGTPEQVAEVRHLPNFDSYSKILGVGGCLALDIAKAAAVDGQHLKVIPTVLSTNCITKNRSVIGDGLDAFSYRTGTPEQVIVPLDDIAAQPELTRSFWSQSGFGDFLSKISAMVEQLDAKGRPATPNEMRRVDPEVVDGLQWINESFTGYHAPELAHLAELAHDAGVKVLSSPNNDISIGGEHKFYKAMMDLDPKLRYGPTHGQVVAIGTLVTVAAYAENTGDDHLYGEVRGAFDKLGIPTSWGQLEALGVNRNVMEKTLDRLAQPDIKKSYLGEYFKTHDMSILDRVFG